HADDAAVMVEDGANEVDLLGTNLSPVHGQAQEGIPARALDPGGRAEDAAVVADRRSAALAAEIAAVEPKLLAVRGGDPDQAGAQELDVLPDAADLGHDRGGIPGDVVVLLLRPPADRARPLVKAHEGGGGPARAANQRLAVDQGGFGVGPQVAVALEVFLEV